MSDKEPCELCNSSEHDTVNCSMATVYRRPAQGKVSVEAIEDMLNKKLKVSVWAEKGFGEVGGLATPHVTLKSVQIAAKAIHAAIYGKGSV